MIISKVLKDLFLGNLTEIGKIKTLNIIKEELDSLGQEGWTVDLMGNKLRITTPRLRFDINKFYMGFETNDYFNQKFKMFNPIQYFREEIDIFFEESTKKYKVLIKTYLGEYKNNYFSFKDSLIFENFLELSLEDIVSLINYGDLIDKSYRKKELRIGLSKEKIAYISTKTTLTGKKLIDVLYKISTKDKSYNYIIESEFVFDSSINKKYIIVDNQEAMRIKLLMDKNYTLEYNQLIKILWKWV